MRIKSTLSISLFLIILSFTNCKNLKQNVNISQKKKSELVEKKETLINHPKYNLSNKLYLLAPDFDSKKGESFAECDCCSSNYLFLDNNNFICVDYCLETDTFYSGKYTIENEEIKLKYNSTIVKKSYNLERETDTINELPEYIYKTEKSKSFQTHWEKFDCKEKICFKTIGEQMDYASVDKNQTPESFLVKLKKEGILKKLKI